MRSAPHAVSALVAAVLAAGFLAGCSDTTTPDATTPAEGRAGAGAGARSTLPKLGEAHTALAPVSVYATGFSNPRGLRFGPDGRLYVAEAGSGGTVSTEGQCEQVPPPVGPYLGGNTAQVVRIERNGEKTVVAKGLPSDVNALGFMSGVTDVDFIGGQLYVLVDGAGCSHGHADTPNGIRRVNADGSTTLVADLSAFYKSHPVANPEPDDFEPDGTPYSMTTLLGHFFVMEANHGDFTTASLDGTVRRVADISATYGHIVPTTVTNRAGHFFIGNLNTFPVVPGSSQIIEITRDGPPHTLVEGLTAVLGSAWDRQGRLYVLESSTVPGDPTPGTGRIRRIDKTGEVTTIAEGLSVPSSMTMGPDGNLYVSNVGYGAPPVGLGEILKVTLQ